MRTSWTASALLLSTLTLAPGCDEAYLDGEDISDGEVTERCLGAGCSSGPISNTSKIGDHDLSNLALAFNQAAANTGGSVKIVGGAGYFGANPVPITEVAVDGDGELRLKLGTAGWIAGVAVKKAWFNLIVTPSDGNQAPFSGKLMVADVHCDPGQEDPSMTICRYEFVTNVLPADPNQYPQHTEFPGYYHTCPLQDEGGALSATEKYAAVLSPNATLYVPSTGAPRINVSPGYYINGCLNGAVSKGQYHLNAFYDANAYRGLDPKQRTAMLLMWMAWHQGASRTQPGKKIWPHDPIGGLFTWTSLSTWDVEAGYGISGASCRGTGPGLATGLHRNYTAPTLTLVGWSALTPCTAGTLDQYAVLGVKVEK